MTLATHKALPTLVALIAINGFAQTPTDRWQTTVHGTMRSEVTSSPTQTVTGDPIKDLEFDLASIRPEQTGGTSHTVKLGFTNNGYSAEGATLDLLLQQAYGIHDERQVIGMPKWAEAESYSIEARFDDSTADKLGGQVNCRSFSGPLCQTSQSELHLRSSLLNTTNSNAWSRIRPNSGSLMAPTDIE